MIFRKNLPTQIQFRKKLDTHMELQMLVLDTIVNSIIKKKSWFNQLKKESLCSIIIFYEINHRRENKPSLLILSYLL